MNGLIPPRSIPAALALIGLALSAPTPSSAQISTTFSYFVPQAGPVAMPLEGPAATVFFRACPNNDGGTSLPNSARLKVVVKDIANKPMVGIPVDSVCAMFSEADTIFAGSPCDSSCPHIHCLWADAPTDINGVTYITFTGALAANPGVGVRDPHRKWGHNAPIIPVTIGGLGGVELQGRLTSGSANGTYVLQIKNFDLVGGWGFPCIPGAGESVDASDLGAFSWCLGVCPISEYMDFNWDGVVGPADLNIFIQHLGHNCTTPLDP